MKRVLNLTPFLFSAGGVGAQQGQHLPLPHHKHLQGDDVLQRLPHPCGLSQLYAPLENPEILHDVRWALQAAAAHPLPGRQSPEFVLHAVCCLHGGSWRTSVCVCQTLVKSVRQAADYARTGRWELVTENKEGQEERHVFDAVICCSGHFTAPNIPLKDFPGKHRQTVISSLKPIIHCGITVLVSFDSTLVSTTASFTHSNKRIHQSISTMAKPYI